MFKVLAWIIAFPISFLLITLLAILDYIKVVYDMPFDVWDAILNSSNDD